MEHRRAGRRGLLRRAQRGEEFGPCQTKRLGIGITRADVDRLWKDWDSRLRINSNGERTLLEMIKDEGTTRKEFVEQMWHILRKERIAKHPEYFSMVKSKRLSKRTQLCLTNPQVIAIAKKVVRGWIKAAPQATIFSVSSMRKNRRCSGCVQPCRSRDHCDFGYSYIGIFSYKI